MKSKIIDIRKITGRPQGVNVKTTITTMLIKDNWVAIKIGKIDGWFVFNRILKSKKKLGNKWYVGFSSVFNTAITKARKIYDVKIPTKNWGKVKIKHYNFTNISNIDIMKIIIEKSKE